MNKWSLIALTILLLPQHSQAQKRASKYPDRIVQTFSGTKDNARAVTWRTNMCPRKGFVLITEATASPDFTENVDTIPAKREILLRPYYLASYFSAELPELDPEKEYVYRVGNKKRWSEWFQFKAGRADSNHFSFMYYGDAQNGIKDYCSRNFRGSVFAHPDVEFLLHAGDLINNANSNKQWGEWFNAGGWIFSTYPNIVAPGNHEYVNTLLHGHQGILSAFWRPSFTLPDNGPEKHKENVYYVDYKNARIIVLDTREMMVKENSAKEQASWLESVLKNCPKKWIIVTHHHPVAGLRRSREGVYTDVVVNYLKPLYDKYGVDLVLQGHDHAYARGTFPVTDTTPQGPVYAVSVSGPKMYQTTSTYFYSTITPNMQLYQYIKVSNNTIEYKSYNVMGELIDEFKITKNGSNKTVLPK